MARFGDLDTQYFDDSGDVLSYGKIRFYKSGTTTDKDTYADQNHAILNANPVILNADGTQPNVFYDGTAKAILYDSNDVQIRQLDPIGGDLSSGAFESWSSAKNYNNPDIVTGDDNKYYQSITSGNQGNDPTSDPVNWLSLGFIYTYNANATFSTDNVVVYGGLLYTSKIDSNLNNQPDISPTQWEPLAHQGAFKVITETVIGATVSSVEFTGLSTNYDTYMIEGHNVATDEVSGSHASTLLLQVSDDGGATWKTASGDYYYGAVAIEYIALPVASDSTSDGKSFFSISLNNAAQSDEYTSAMPLNGYVRKTATDFFGLSYTLKNIYVRSVAESNTAVRLIVQSGDDFVAGTIKLIAVK